MKVALYAKIVEISRRFNNNRIDTDPLQRRILGELLHSPYLLLTTYYSKLLTSYYLI